MFRNWLSQTGPEVGGLDSITSKFGQMLEDGRHVFDLAANGLLGGIDPGVIREDLFKTDARINATEQEIRRALVVHGSVHGSMNIAELLVMMSLVKDAERIGDYGKNLFDLVAEGTGLVDDAERQRLVQLKDRVSKQLVRARNIYDDQDEASALAFLREADELEDQCDASIHRLLGLEGANAAGAVLTYRYFKRVTSHAANIVSSLVMPVDKLDFFDEPKG
jgi:phosphate transport system protein